MPVHYSEHSAGPDTRRQRGFPESATEPASGNYENLSRNELKAELAQRGLDATGRAKADLIARLEEDDAA